MNDNVTPIRRRAHENNSSHTAHSARNQGNGQAQDGFTTKPEDDAPTIEFALYFASLGQRIIPIPPRSKGPHLKGWTNRATSDREQIRRWFADCPRGNYGILTTGLVAVDIDPQHGGDEWLRENEERLPDSWRFRTGQGGYHIVYRPPTGQVVGSPVEVAPGVDIRGDRAQIVGPGSYHPNGRRYEIETGPDDVDMAEAPQWLLELIEQPRPTGQTDDNHDDFIEGERNIRLTSEAGALRRRGYDEETIYALLRTLNSEKCQPPLPDNDVRRIAHSISRYPDQTADFGINDTDNGNRLVLRHGENLRYCYSWKQWLSWDGRQWGDDSTGRIAVLCKETASAIYGESALVATTDANRAKSLGKWAASSLSRNRLEAMAWAAQSELPVTPNDLNANNLLNLENGTLDLETLELHLHCRDNLITKIAPVSFNANSTCPTWLFFLERIFDQDAELISFVQRAIGYSMTDSVREEVFFFCHGGGSNGKTTLINTVADMLGDYASPIRIEALLATDRNRGGGATEDIANLFRVRFAHTGEPNNQFRLNEALIKQLTGRDKIHARRLYEDLFEFEPTHKIWFAANHKPEIRGVDEGIWRRVMMIPFEVTIPERERDRDLSKKLKSELDGIFAWAVEGLQSYKDRGLDPPESVRAAKDAYRREMDILADFLEAKCQVGEGCFVAKAVLLEVYNRFVGMEAVQPKTFSKLLKERGFQDDQRRINGNNTRIWKGVSVNEEDDTLDDPSEEVPF